MSIFYSEKSLSSLSSDREGSHHVHCSLPLLRGIVVFVPEFIHIVNILVGYS